MRLAEIGRARVGYFRTVLPILFPLGILQCFFTTAASGEHRGKPLKNIGENVVRIEAAALNALADRIAGPMAVAFQKAVDLLF